MYVCMCSYMHIYLYCHTLLPLLLPQFVHLQNALFIVCRKQMRFLYVVVVVVVIFTVVFSAALFVRMHIHTSICMYLFCMYVQVTKYISTNAPHYLNPFICLVFSLSLSPLLPTERRSHRRSQLSAQLTPSSSLSPPNTYLHSNTL